MPKVFMILIFLSQSLSALAQNLVSNGNFETYTQCPTNGLSQTTNQQIYYAIGWQVSGQTPDYWHSCSDGFYNTMGFQADYSGESAYAGLYVIASMVHPGDDIGREYIGTKLIDTLMSGHKYLASMYVNRSNGWNMSVASLGMLFTDTAVGVANPNQYNVFTTPQIRNTSVLKDTLNWILIQDTLIATGNEAYITIGNFNTTATSDTVHSPGGFGTWSYFEGAYYYIDGVSVYDVTSQACNGYWDAGFSKNIITGDSVRIGAIDTDNSTYTWLNSAGGATFLSSNNDARPWASPTVTTTYQVIKTCPNSGGIFMDTVTVIVQQPVGVNHINVSADELKIYPNPCKDNATFKYVVKSNSTMAIFDVRGVLVKHFDILAGHNTLELSTYDLSSGVYYCRLITEGLPIISKLVIQN